MNGNGVSGMHSVWDEEKPMQVQVRGSDAGLHSLCRDCGGRMADRGGCVPYQAHEGPPHHVSSLCGRLSQTTTRIENSSGNQDPSFCETHPDMCTCCCHQPPSAQLAKFMHLCVQLDEVRQT